MIEALLGELAVAGETEVVTAAGEHLAEKIKTSKDIKKLFVDTGEFFIDFEPQAEQLFRDMSLVLSKENMMRMASELKNDSGYTFKERLLNSLISLMDKYEIPREYATFYANSILYTILNQLPEVAPQKYDRYFQSEWREEQEKTLLEIKQKIDKVNCEIELYKSKSIAIESAGQLDIRIRKQTNNPRIGIEFFDIDDDNFKELFEDQKTNEIIRVRAKCREEAIYCIINELWRSNEKRAIFVVKAPEDWEKLSQSASTGNIYIPWFLVDEICAIENNTNIFIYTEGIPSFSHDEIQLRSRTFNTISNALVKAGMGVNEANNLVSETHGLYIPMKRKIFNGQYLKKPEWIDGLSDNIKKTALLIGQWTDLDGDKVVVSILSGMSYDDFVDAILPFSKGEDPFVHVVKSNGNRAFYLASVENSWEYLDIENEDKIWETFKGLFVDVLNESEKIFVYTTQERMLAQFKGERLFWSSTLRSGMIRSLIMKAFYRNDCKFQESLDSLIQQLLGNIQTEEHWKYISNFFVDLCEVSPKAVINRLFLEYEKPTGLMSLFDTQTSDFILGKNCYIDILFGVDEFLVQNEYASRGFEWLLKLDDRSYEYKSNSPKDTISKVLCSWYNFSAFRTVEEKITAARLALELDRNAWNYVFEALPTNARSILGEIHKPKYRQHVENEPITKLEMIQTVEQYVILLIEKIDFNPDRCAKLLGIADELSEKISNKIFDTVLYQISQMSALEQADLKKQIRQIIYKHRYYESASWAMGEAKVKRYEELLNEITISIPEYEYVYLFDSDNNDILLNPIPYDQDGKFDANEEKTQEAIKAQIADFKEKKLDLSVLAEACSLCKTSTLGRFLAKYDNDDAFNQNTFEILYNAQECKSMALDYCQGMYAKDKAVFEKVMEKNGEMKYENGFIVGMYRIQAIYAEDIPLIDSAAESVKAIFWKSEIYLNKNYEWALRECKKYGNLSVYVHLLFHANMACKFSNEALFDYMIDIYKMPHDEQVGNLQYYISELIEPLQKEYATVPEKAQKLVELEIHFFGLLDWKQMKCFRNEISRTPEAFAEIVSIIFKRDDKDASEEKTDEQKQLVSSLYRLYYMAHFCPAENNGTVDSNDLDNWLSGLIDLLKKNHQENLFGFLVGRLFAFSPQGKDGYYPCEAVREAIEKYADDSLATEYRVTLFNERGVFTPTEGRAEKAIAEKHRSTADYFKINYPKTAEIYYGMYRHYMAEAEEERNRAENGHF